MKFRTYLDIQEYAEDLLRRYELHDWSFEWDMAKSRLGCCKYKEKAISLSYHFVTTNADDETQIVDTILHELAHALAWTHHKEPRHGAKWKEWCRIVGAKPKATVRRDAIETLPPHYLVKISDTGEVVGEYHRRPRFANDMERMMIPGRPETLGKLELWVLRSDAD